MSEDIYATFISADRRLFVANPATIYNTFIPAGREAVDLNSQLANVLAGNLAAILGVVPTTDPAVPGALWNNGGFLCISLG